MIYAEIVSRLTSRGIGAFGTNLFWGRLPDTPDSAVAVFEYLGEPSVRSKDGDEWERPRFQVIARAKSYVAAMQKAEDAYAALNGFSGNLEGAHYDSITARQRPFADPSGVDDADRFRVFCNYSARRQAPEA